MDYLLLSTVLYENSVSIPHIAAGLNLAFWPMGHIFRRCGAFFIRRTFAGNPLYRAVVKSYLKTLLKEGYCQEFFIEGGRSRTGKLLRPKRGILTMLTEGIREGATKEAVYVPVSITYDKVIEEYKAEHEGENKKKERTRDLLRLGKYLKRKYGRIYVRFGEPISYIDDGRPVDQVVSALANQFMVTMNRELVATPASLVATSILVSPKRGVSSENVTKNADEILNFLKWKNAHFSDTLEADKVAALNEAVAQFTSGKQLELHKEFEPAFFEVKENARLSLDYYKNNIIHFLISASCLANILLAYNRKGMISPPMTDVKEYYIFCKALFAHEFAFSTRMDVESHIGKTLSYFEQTGIISASARLETFKGLLTNYFEAYLVALLAVQNISEIEEKDLYKRMIKYGRHMLLLGKITKNEAISAQIFKNSISNYTKMGLICEKRDEKGRKLYSSGEKPELFSNLKQKLEELT